MAEHVRLLLVVMPLEGEIAMLEMLGGRFPTITVLLDAALSPAGSVAVIVQLTSSEGCAMLGSRVNDVADPSTCPVCKFCH